MNSPTLGPKYVKSRRGESISVGDPSELLGDLLEKCGGYFGGIRLQVLVAINEECSHGRGKYTRLESVVPKVNGVPNIDELFQNVHI